MLSVSFLDQVYRLRLETFSRLFLRSVSGLFAFFVDFGADWEPFWETFRDLLEVYGILPDCTPSCTKTYFLRF